MKYSLYVIFDKVAKESGFPFDAKNDEVALRKFNGFIAQVEKDSPSSVDEFELRRVGSFDSESCEILDTVSSVVNLSDIL